MAERRQLNEQERQAAAAFAQALEASTYSLDSLADELEVTPGAVGHWYRGEIAIPLRRVAHISTLLRCAPEAISCEWREFMAPHLPASVLLPREAVFLQNFRQLSDADKATLERVADSLTNSVRLGKFSLASPEEGS